jgi:hypothetical protein
MRELIDKSMSGTTFNDSAGSLELAISNLHVRAVSYIDVYVPPVCHTTLDTLVTKCFTN